MKKSLVLLLIFSIILTGCAVETPPQAYDLAACMAEKGVVMYGAYWCGHCNDVKRSFGEAFASVDYVECDPHHKDSESQRCLDEGIEGYPTFVFGEERVAGFSSLEDLAFEVGCSYE